MLSALRQIVALSLEHCVKTDILSKTDSYSFRREKIKFGPACPPFEFQQVCWQAIAMITPVLCQSNTTQLTVCFCNSINI